MRTRTVRQMKRAFTLIEILIVVVILGILAAIVIPQFTDASQEASASSMKSTLQTVRSQLELYRVKSGGQLPAGAFAAAMQTLVDEGYLQRVPQAPGGYLYDYDDSPANVGDPIFWAECDTALADHCNAADADYIGNW